MQAQPDGVARNRPIYEAIAQEHADAGYDRTWQLGRTKIKNLQQRYGKVYNASYIIGEYIMCAMIHSPHMYFV